MTPRTAYPLALRSTAAAVAALVTLLILDSPQVSAGTGAPAPRAKASATERAKVRTRAHRAHLARSKSATKPATRQAAGPAAIPAGAAGMRAAIDPATGRLTRPNVQDDAGLPTQGTIRRVETEDISRTLPIETLPNGAEMVKLDERFQEYEVARVGKDGKVRLDCVHGTEDVAKHRAKPVKPATPKREVQ